MRVLLLGPTGTDKSQVANRLQACEGNGHQTLQFIDFERDYLKQPSVIRGGDFPNFLTKDPFEQLQAWRIAWANLKQKIDDGEESDITVMSMHATLVRHFYGVRILMDVNAVCSDYRPELVITLFDDVYNMWWRTEARAGGNDHYGRPSLEQLLMARRAEAMLGDQVAATMQVVHNEKCRHVAMSVNHPVHTLCRLVFQADCRVVYLSFPISAPREALERGDGSLVNAVNQFHSAAMNAQKAHSNLAFISPLSIDELPFVKATNPVVEERAKAVDEAKVAINSADCDSQTNLAKQELDDIEAKDWRVELDLSKRWALDEIWGDEPLISSGAPSPTPFPLLQAEQVRGAIQSDVGWRDNRLVMQSDALAVFSPVMPRLKSTRMARGVKEELMRAMVSGIRSFVFQDPSVDPTQVWEDWYGTMGSMGMGPVHELIKSYTTMPELFNDLPVTLGR